MNAGRKDSWVERGLGWGWWHGFLVMECPEGHRALVHLDTYSIRPDGTMSPAYACVGGKRPCGFHQHLRLLRWEGDLSLEMLEQDHGP